MNIRADRNNFRYRKMRKTSRETLMGSYKTFGQVFFYWVVISAVRKGILYQREIVPVQLQRGAVLC